MEKAEAYSNERLPMSQHTHFNKSPQVFTLESGWGKQCMALAESEMLGITVQIRTRVVGLAGSPL